MGMKFNPFTGKLDIVGMSEERFAELSEKESTIEEGLVFRTWGGLKAPYDFSAEGKAMTVKKTLETIILEKVNATIEGKGGFDEFVNVPHICSPVFTITRKSYPITQIVVKHYNASNQLIDTLTLNKNTKSYIENNTNLDINSVVIKNGNTPVSVDNLFDTDGNLAYSSLTIAMPSLSVQAYNKWTGTITENTTDPEKDELPTSNDVTASVEAKFHYPKLVIMADYAKIKSDHAGKIALRYTSSTQKLSVKRMPDGEGYYAVGDFRGGEQNTATFTLTGTKLFGNPNKIDFNTGETLCIICKDRQVNQNWESSFGGIKDWEKGLPMQGGMVERTPQVSIYLDDATDPIVAGGSVHWHLFFIDTSYNAGSQPFEVNFK